MKLRILTAVAVLGAVMSGQAFAAGGTFEPFTYELCDQSPRELAASSKSDSEFDFVTAMCKRHDPNYGKIRAPDKPDWGSVCFGKITWFWEKEDDYCSQLRKMM